MGRKAVDREGQQAAERRAPFPKRRAGTPERRAAPRPDEGAPGRRFTDYLRTTPHFVCIGCGEPWITELMHEWLEEGHGCPRCGGRLEPVGQKLEGDDLSD
jgi:DNA-directed RNA polymerase subunit RPC12/RpoP